MGNDPRLASLREHFIQRFGGDDADDNPHNDAPIHVCRAPGRVNLIGEHVDYNGGLVMPVAIDPHVTFAFRRRSDDRIHIYSDEYPEEDVVFEIDDDSPGEPGWSNYIRGPVAHLRRRGEMLMGLDCYLVNSLPSGAGLSSSAALLVGTAVMMLHLGGGTMEGGEIARLCQAAEHEFADVPSGIMDQTAVACAREGHAMLIDCRSKQVTHVPLDSERVAVVIANTGRSRSLGGGEYRQRREQCEEAARALGLESLRDATADRLEEKTLDDPQRRRARHVVSEIERVRKFAEALRGGDLKTAGEQMYASHESLREDFEVSTQELDFLVEAARGIDGVYGSRLTGGGFGGCTVTLCDAGRGEEVAGKLGEAFEKQFGQETHPFMTSAAEGARVVD